MSQEREGQSGRPSAPIVIVGASVAGLTAVEELRKQGHTGEIVVVDESPTYPPDRPPLSKVVLTTSDAEGRFEVLPAARRESLKVTGRLGVRAVGLDSARRVVQLESGEMLAYSDLVIASGVRPRRLPGPLQFDRGDKVHVLRTAHDAAQLRQALSHGGHLGVVGGGVLGLEVAATARGLGCAVTVIEPDPAALAGKIGPTMAARLRELHDERGVQTRVGVGLAEMNGENLDSAGVVRLHLTDGTTVEVADVLLAIGCVPNTEWLDGSGLDLADGVVCNAFGSATEHVWAAGDVAHWAAVGPGTSHRLEHKQNAIDQARRIARNIVATRSGDPCDGLVPPPYFWTDQFDVKIQVAGRYSPEVTESVRPVEGREGAFVVRFELDGRLTGAATWNAAKLMTSVRREIEQVQAEKLVSKEGIG